MIPEELKRLHQWVCWQGTPDPARPGKLKKVPINPKTGGHAQSNNPDTWSDYQTAVKASGNYSGVGLMFANGYFGVDIDDAEEAIKDYKAGGNDNIIAEFVYTLESYAEYSQSGKGLHIICKGTLPDGGRRKGNVEMYSEGRYFIMTGKQAAEYGDIVDCTETIKPLHAKYIGGGKQTADNTAAANTAMDLDDEQIIQAALASKQGSGFQTLRDGLWQGLYQSQSDADLAFCNMLAFWFGRDKSRMDRIFRASGLYRDKWDRKTSGERTYGDITLNKAITGCRDVYTPGGEMDNYSLTIGGVSTNGPPKAKETAPPKFYSYDDTGNAERFRTLFGDRIRYSYVNKSWYYYQDGKWHQDQIGRVDALADDMLPEMLKEAAYLADGDQEKAFNRHMKYTRSNKGKEALVKGARHRLSIMPDGFDQDIFALNTKNGILDLKSGKLLPHSAEAMLSKMTACEYSPNADCPLWKNFLQDIFASDKDMMHYIQKAVGYTLSGSVQEQCLFILIGNGRNGKSTFLDIISDLAGDYAANIQPETIMVKKMPSTANSDIARLKGARLVTTTETNDGVRFNEGLLKQLTGGDKVTARHLYGHEFEFRPEFKIWLATNHKPVITGLDDGIWRRIHLIPFGVQIPAEKVDKNLKDKLKAEYTGILNWAAEGFLLWTQEGLKQPGIVRQATADYKTEMDVIAAFLDECTRRGPGEVRANDLYLAYRQWAEENGHYKWSNQRFGREISKRYSREKDRLGYKYLGLQLLEDRQPYRLHFKNN